MNHGPVMMLGLLLGALLGCGGGSAAAPTPVPLAPASRLTYADPAGSGWRFIRLGGTGTTADPLLLELRGPATIRVRGVAFFLELPAGSTAAWAALGTKTWIAPAPTFDLGAEPQFLKDRLSGSELQAGLFQKGGDADPSLGLVRVGLSLKPNATVGELGLLQNAAKAAVLNGDGSVTTPVAIQFGTLRAE